MSVIATGCQLTIYNGQPQDKQYQVVGMVAAVWEYIVYKTPERSFVGYATSTAICIYHIEAGLM